MKHEVLKDSVTAQLDTISLMIGLKATLGLKLGINYVKGAYRRVIVEWPHQADNICKATEGDWQAGDHMEPEEDALKDK